jgi:hypothetical protein
MIYQIQPTQPKEGRKDKELLKKINSEIGYYASFRPTSFPRFTRNQGELLKLIDSYHISQYRDGDTDPLGQKKTFYNINSLPVDISSKQLDIDTKNIQIANEDWASLHGSILMEMELRMWLKLGYYGRELNKHSYMLSKYGHLIVKKVGNKVLTVPLQNLIFRPDAKTLDDTPIIEMHYYNSVEDFKKEAESLGWEDYQVVIAQFQTDKKELIVYEMLDPTAEGDNYFIVSRYGDRLASTQLSKNIYKGLAYETLPHRLMGRGQVEKLFEEQIYLNRIGNYKAEGLHWGSKNIFQSRDTNISSNLLADIENGDVLKTQDRIDRVDTREQNLQMYSYEENRYEQNAYRRSFSTNPMSGEGTQAGVPFRSLYMQSQQAGGFYKQKREELGMFEKEILTDWVIPDFKNDKRKEHKVLISSLLSDDQRAETLFEGLVDLKFAEEIKKIGIMTPRQQEVKKAILRERLMKDTIDIPEDYYDTIKYNVKIDVTSEAIDTNVKAQVYMQMATILGQNPTILQNPVTAKIFAKVFEAKGINPIDIGLTRKSLEDVMGQQMAQVGGSVAAPREQLPQMTPQTMTI